MTNINLQKKTMEELNRPSIEELAEIKKQNIWIILDNIRSMNNVGSVFRTADAFNIQGIMLCGLTPKPPHRDIQKTALGATDSVYWEYHQNVEMAIHKLKEKSIEIWAIEQTHHSVPLEKFQFSDSKQIALIFGNEVHGVSDSALSLCKGSLEIKQWGAKHSLNISVTAGIVLWEFVREIK